jgi:hypothetical protein
MALLERFIYSMTECTVRYRNLFKMEHAGHFENLPIERPKEVQELKQGVHTLYYFLTSMF